MFSLSLFFKLRCLTFYVAFPSKRRWNEKEEEQRDSFLVKPSTTLCSETKKRRPSLVTLALP